MPTLRRRICFIPSPVLDGLIDDVCRYTGHSRARVVAEMLDNVAPVFASTVEALRFVAEGRFEQAQAAIAEVAQKGVSDLQQAQLDLDAAVRKTRQGDRKTTPRLGTKKRKVGGAASSA